jgi:hypothetical protein
VASSWLNSSGFRYRVQCSRLMAHRMVREEAAVLYRAELERGFIRALRSRGTALNALLTMTGDGAGRGNLAAPGQQSRTSSRKA